MSLADLIPAWRIVLDARADLGADLCGHSPVDLLLDNLDISIEQARELVQLIDC